MEFNFGDADPTPEQAFELGTLVARSYSEPIGHGE